MSEYFEGTRIISNDDGSTTYITYEHEPYSEPLSRKQSVVLGLITLGAPLVILGVPIALAKVADVFDDKKRLKDRQKLNKEIFLTMKKTS